MLNLHGCLWFQNRNHAACLRFRNRNHTVCLWFHRISQHRGQSEPKPLRLPLSVKGANMNAGTNEMTEAGSGFCGKYIQIQNKE